MGEQTRAAKRLRARGELRHANGYDHVESRMGDPLGRAGLIGRRGVVGVPRVARAPRRHEAWTHPHHQVRPALGLRAALVAAPARGWSARGPEVVRWIIRCCSEYPAGMVQSEAHL